MKIGIYGGTFNPPHLGHLAAARAAAGALGLDKLVFVPAGVPPHKIMPAGSPDDRQRLAMTSIAADQLLRPELTAVWDEEVKASRKELHLRYPLPSILVMAPGGAVAVGGDGYVPDIAYLAQAGRSDVLGGNLHLWPDRKGHGGSLCSPAGLSSPDLWGKNHHHHHSRPGGHLVHPPAGAALRRTGRAIPGPGRYMARSCGKNYTELLSTLPV